ncbi:MAG: glycosyltransferase family 39 protein [Chloroflexi bacterium]|nr:glycosyltransferase family 39 protein [Chloroflexota bacterium]
MAKSAPGTLFRVTDLLTLGLIVSGALALRLWQIDTIPPGLWFDEAVNAHDALRVWRGELHVFFPGNFGREALYIYALAPLVGLLGPGVVPIRLASVGFGLSGIVGAYLLGRTLFNRPIAIASALLMALSFWHLHLSRMGFRAISLPSALAMGAFFVWYGVRAGQRWAFPVGGAFLGLSFHTYIVSRAVSPLLGLLLVAVILAQPAMSRECFRSWAM